MPAAAASDADTKTPSLSSVQTKSKARPSLLRPGRRRTAVKPPVPPAFRDAPYVNIAAAAAASNLRLGRSG